MTEIDLYKILIHHKGKFTRQQYLTIKGQIRKRDYAGAYKGIMKCIEKRKIWKEHKLL